MQELSLRMEQMHDKMIKKRKLLDTEMTESVTAQIELDKTAENFRKAHHERETFIEQWEQTIHQMRKRDQDMDKCADVRTENLQLSYIIHTLMLPCCFARNCPG